MWQYSSHNIDGKTVGGKTVVRIILIKGEESFSSFLDYETLPEDSEIIALANIVAEQKNQQEAVE